MIRLALAAGVVVTLISLSSHSAAAEPIVAEGRVDSVIVYQGQALVTLDGCDRHCDAGDTIHIPVETKHRIANPGSHDLVFVEVQRGTYFGEDDIIRFDDDYGRA